MADVGACLLDSRALLPTVQVATSLRFLKSVRWPTGFETFLSAFSFINVSGSQRSRAAVDSCVDDCMLAVNNVQIDFVPFNSIGCVATVSELLLAARFASQRPPKQLSVFACHAFRVAPCLVLSCLALADSMCALAQTSAL
jgi:hypothetical protein